IRGSLKGWAKYWCVVRPGMLIIYKSAKRRQWIGRCWMDALEVGQRQGYNLVRDTKGMASDLYGKEECREEPTVPEDADDGEDSNDGIEKSDSEDEKEDTVEPEKQEPEEDEPFEESVYVEEKGEEYLGQEGEATEEIEEDNKSILWALLKQVKPGMDLSRVTLPTFILEPRSFLDKLSDFYYHCYILRKAAKEECAYERMKEVARWYLSGFYKKPKGLKKPYNPIIGELFRCYWKNTSGSKTYFVAEQVSHHPPVSAFYVSNRTDGYVINGSILAKSKFYDSKWRLVLLQLQLQLYIFYPTDLVNTKTIISLSVGNSTSAILDGTATLTLLKYGEEYLMTMPYAHCKGILIGTLTFELGGTVTINCEKTGYRAEIEFKLKPFWKKSGESNYLAGKIKMGNQTLCKIEGKWDGEIIIEDLKSSNLAEDDVLPDLFWEPTPDVKAQRLGRHLIDFDRQKDNECEKQWIHVSNAIRAIDQEKATQEKFTLEEAQRKGHRERKEQNVAWVPKLFEQPPDADGSINRWVYKYTDVRQWDPMTDLIEYEHDGIIKTRYRLKAPMIRTTSILSVHTPGTAKKPSKRKRPSSGRSRLGVAKGSRRNSVEHSGASTPDLEGNTSSIEDDYDDVSLKEGVDQATLEKTIQPLRDLQKECVQQMRAIRNDLRKHYSSHQDEIASLQFKDWVVISLLVIFQAIFQWYLR
ncbi:hypothetical protein QZH41_019029, partial [Actinostola sp. cb2023]